MRRMGAVFFDRDYCEPYVLDLMYKLIIFTEVYLDLSLTINFAKHDTTLNHVMK